MGADQIDRPFLFLLVLIMPIGNDMLHSAFKINDTVVFPEKNQLQRDNQIIEITPKSVKLLQLLARSKGNIVSYQQISDEIWNGVVSEGALYQQVTQLRRALGDNPTSPTYIKTLPRQGYRFIADISKIENQPSTKKEEKYVENTQKSKKNITITIVILLISTTTSTIFLNNKVNYESILDLLIIPDNKIILVKENHPELNNASAILSFLLENSPKYHFSSTNSYGNRFLQRHIKSNNLSKITTLKLSHSKKSINLSIKNTQNREDLIFTYNSKDRSLQGLNLWLMRSISKANIKPTKTIKFSRDTSAEISLMNAINDIGISSDSRASIENSRDRALRALRLNPKNLLAYSLFFDRTSDLLNLSGGFNLDQSLSQLESNANKALSLSKNYHKAHYALSEVYCNFEDNKKCFQHLTSALIRNPFHHTTLSVLDWNLKRNNISTKKLSKYNFLLNPSKNQSRIFYRNQLISDGKLHQATQLMNEVPFSMTLNNKINNWNYLAQADSKSDNNIRFSNYYRKHFTHSSEGENSTPSRYIAYKLIDSNRPQLAKYWLKNGKGHTQEYFDIQTSDLIISLMSNANSSNKWHTIREFAEDRSKFQDPIDKFRLAFFNYYFNNLNLSKGNLLEFYPNLSKQDLSIDRNNFRTAVYYAEILKRQGDFKNSAGINKKLRRYLQLSDAFSRRGNDIGIADIEFYALNGDANKAMERLHLAIERQGWLPNAYWLWLPLDINPFLKSLYQRGDFKQLQQSIVNRLDNLCFDQQCN